MASPRVARSDACRFLVRRLAVLFLSALIGMTLVRVLFLRAFADPTQWSRYLPYLPRAFWLGVRFDGMVLAYLQAPITLLMLLLLPFPRWPQRWLSRAVIVYYSLGLFVVFGACLADIGFYSYFQDHINVLIFGLWEDDTVALLRTFWRDYPIVWMLAGLIAGTAAMVYGVCRLLRWRGAEPGGRRGCGLPFAVFLLANVLFGRASLGTFPLRWKDTAISPYLLVNQLPINGAYALKRAISTRLHEHARDWVADLGYTGHEADAVRAFAPWARGDSLEALVASALRHRTPERPAAQLGPPHVVLVMMESLNSYLMRWHRPSFDLLGAFARHWQAGPSWPVVLPADNGTIGSINAIVTGVPLLPGTSVLSESSRTPDDLPTAPAEWFREAGYETVFLYGGSLGWRRLNTFLPRQGFDHVEGEAEVEAFLRQAGRGEEPLHHEWGIFDGPLFAYLQHRLERASKPLFVILLTTTNHPPFTVPRGYRPRPLEWPPALRARITGDPRRVQERFRCFQYASDALGRWLDALEASSVGRRTIVAVTGDHNVGDVVTYRTGEWIDKRAVPLFLRVPESYRPPIRPRTDRPLTHLDLLPTLYDLALPGREGPAFGRSVWDTDRPPFAYNVSGLLLDDEVGLIWDRADPKPLCRAPDGLTVCPPTSAHRRLQRRYEGLLVTSVLYLRTVAAAASP